jgi:hypothetical protein
MRGFWKALANRQSTRPIVRQNVKFSATDLYLNSGRKDRWRSETALSNSKRRKTMMKTMIARRFTQSILFLGLISPLAAQAQLIRVELGRGELPNPVFPTAPYQLREVKVRIPPHGFGPWHYHPGPAQIIVLPDQKDGLCEGGTFSLTQDELGCPATILEPGSVAVEPNGPEGSPHVHQPSNPSDKWTCVLITFTLPPGTEMDLIPVDPQNCVQ